MGKGIFVLKPTEKGYVFNLKAENGETIGISELYTSEAACRKGIASVVKNLIELYSAFENDDKKTISGMISEYRTLSMLTGQTVTVNPVAGTNSESYKAKVEDVDEEMRLVVETENGEIRKLNSGEVSLHTYDFI